MVEGDTASGGTIGGQHNVGTCEKVPEAELFGKHCIICRMS